MKAHRKCAYRLGRGYDGTQIRWLLRRAVLAILLISACTGLAADTKTVWQIGAADDQAQEFALAPGGYKDFIHQDFGWPDRFYLIGRSRPERDWPYILPGPVDAWAGSTGLAGARTQVLNVLFDLKICPAGDWQLVVDVLETQSPTPPIFKVMVNGHAQAFQLLPGTNAAAVDGQVAGCREQLVVVKLKPSMLRQGGNHIALTSIQGSWLIFDQIRLEGPMDAELSPVRSVFIRDVQAADYEIVHEGKRAQPLLVDLEHIEGNPELSIHLDGRPILSSQIEPGRSVLEVPMPAVSSPALSRYAVYLDGTVLAAGQVTRAGQALITPADYVDPFLGTAHSRWMIAPGPWMPFSMVKLSPDNQNSGWQAGYDPHIENVGGFSHIHEWTMAGLLMMPTNGPLQTQVGDQYKPDEGYRSRIDRAREQARIGYYQVFLSDYDINAELTATTRASFQRYSFPQGGPGRVLIDLQIPAEYTYILEGCEIRKVSDQRIEGWAAQNSANVWSRDAQQEYQVHFVIEFDRPMCGFGVWQDDKAQAGVSLLQTQRIKDAGAFAEFDTAKHPVVQVRTGISLVSVDNAALNLQREIVTPYGWDFEAVEQGQRNTWNGILGRIRVESLDRREKVRFYSNLYRAFCRNTWSDVDGRWRDPEEKIRQFKDPEAVALGCDAFWNTFWNLNQVWNLVTPEWSSRWVKSQLALYDACGWLAKGPAGMEYVPVMVAEHEIPLLVGAYQMGIRDYDVNKVFEAAHKMQTTPGRSVARGFAGNRDLVSYLKYQYVPADLGRASNTLEYAFDDWTLAQLAQALGKTEAHEQFLNRSTWWRNMFDPETGYARLKNADGKWVSPFDPYRSGANKEYVEGNAWQLTYFVPQDVPGLIAALGKDRFLQRLDQGFTRSAETRFNAPNEKYWDYPVVHGNQQSMHFAFLFNWAQTPWLTQKWSREILQRYYGYGPGDAYLGDEDQGQMSAWFIMAALGLFQMDGGCRVDPIYEIGSPLFPKVVIDLGGRFGRGKTFTIMARHASRQNKYVQNAQLNGRPLNRWWFPCRELLQGGELILDMGPEPNQAWGVE